MGRFDFVLKLRQVPWRRPLYLDSKFNVINIGEEELMVNSLKADFMQDVRCGFRAAVSRQGMQDRFPKPDDFRVCVHVCSS